jgi:hypothetical protein
VCAQAWTNEMNDAWGRKIRTVGGGSVLRGAAGRGPEEWASRGGRAGEREGEGGPRHGVE